MITIWLVAIFSFYLGGSFTLLLDSSFSNDFHGKETWWQGLTWPLQLVARLRDDMWERKMKKAARRWRKRKRTKES